MAAGGSASSRTRTSHTAIVQRFISSPGQNISWPHAVPLNTPSSASASMAGLCTPPVTSANPPVLVFWTSGEAVSWEAVSWEAVSWEAVSWEAVSWEGGVLGAVSWEAVSWEAAAGANMNAATATTTAAIPERATIRPYPAPARRIGSTVRWNINDPLHALKATDMIAAAFADRGPGSPESVLRERGHLHNGS